jgi:hypothetical protein
MVVSIVGHNLIALPLNSLRNPLREVPLWVNHLTLVLLAF